MVKFSTHAGLSFIHQRCFGSNTQAARRLPFQWPAEPGDEFDHTPVRSPGFRVDGQHWARPADVWYALPAPYQGDADLQANRQSSDRPALARPHEDREHG